MSIPVKNKNPQFRFNPPPEQFFIVSTSENGDDWTHNGAYSTLQEALDAIEVFRETDGNYDFEWLGFSVWKATWERVDVNVKPLIVGDFRTETERAKDMRELTPEQIARKKEVAIRKVDGAWTMFVQDRELHRGMDRGEARWRRDCYIEEGKLWPY